jgi:hypothetical protein
MISQAFLRTANGIFTACMQRKWLACAVVIWMLVGTTMASPIVAASVSSPAPTTTVAMRRLLTEVSNWAEMKTACGSSGTVALSDDFVMGTYNGECPGTRCLPLRGGIDFSGKHLVIIGNSKTLDAGEKG